MKYIAKDQKTKNAVIYTRVSTEEQAEHGFSLAHQEDTLRKECQRKGIQLIHHFQDDGHSATNFDRPGFQNLLAYFQRHKGQIQFLLVTKWCRFSRDVEKSFMMLFELRKYGVEVRTLDDGEASDNPSSFLLKVLNMALPEVDNRTRSRNTKSGILRALKEGHYPYGTPPRGYSKDRSAPKTPLLIPNQEAELVKDAFEIFATGIFPIEDVRKASWKSGLKLQRTQFGQMLRNPIYIGKIYLLPSENEEPQLVDGIHQGIVSTETFWKVQQILDKRMATKTHLSVKEKLREELPLRGHLLCPQCGKNWSGSISSGNGGKYAYYHCDKDCGARANALLANQEFFELLKSLKPPREVVDLQMAMMEAKFKEKEGDRNAQIKKLRAEVDRCKQNLLRFDQQRFISGELETDSYQRLKTHTLGQIDKLNTDISDLEITDTAFQKYIRYGMSLLSHLPEYFEEADLEIRRKLLGSIFPVKLIFEAGKYRTPNLNPALAIILQKSSQR